MTFCSAGSSGLASTMRRGTIRRSRRTATGSWRAISRRADTYVGAPWRQRHPAVAPDPLVYDDLHTIFARAVKIGAQGYTEVLGSLFADRLVAVPQDLTIGREYRGSMRGLRAEL